MLRACLVATLLALALPVPAATARALKETPVPGTIGALPVGDDRTIAAWQKGAVTALLADGSRRRVSAPSGCPSLSAAGAGRLLFACGSTAGYDAPATYVVVNPRSGAQRRLTIANPYAGSVDGARPTPAALGTQWIRAQVSFHSSVGQDYVNWHTGAYLKGSADPFGPHRRIDLDAAGLARSLCAPYVRTGSTDIVDEDPYANQPLLDGRDVVVRLASGEARLGRCGSPARVSLGRGEVALGGGWVAYDRVYRAKTLRRIADGRRFVLDNVNSVRLVGRDAVISRTGRRLTLVRLPN